MMLEIWSLVPLPLWNPTFTSGSCQFTWSLTWKILSTTLLACEMSTNTVIWTFFCIFFVRDWNENLPVPVLWPLLSFPNLLTYWAQHFNASPFMILNSSAGILSPPLALLVVMLPKAHWLHASGYLALGEWPQYHICMYMHMNQLKSRQSCPPLCKPIDRSLPGSSVHGILQARILEWVAMPSFRESSWPRDWACISYVSCIGRRVLYH